MDDGYPSADRPPLDALTSVFDLRETQSDGDRLFFYGESLVPERMLIREVWPEFRAAGYDVQFAQTRPGATDVLVAKPLNPRIDGIPWKNLALFVATVFSTLFVGAYGWYYIPLETILANPLVMLRAWPFTAAVLGVLSVHELGHYVVGRYHGVDVSLPYLIPFIFPFGTMGAIIRMRGQIPDRKALFDIGVAGPLAGLAATIVVSIIGLLLSPVEVPARVLDGGGQVIVFNNPPLLDLLAWLLGTPLQYEGRLTVHPVIMGGWIGMFFTVLNLLPVGQLDGGHIARAMLGERQGTLGAFVPLALFGLAAYLYRVRDLSLNESVGLWTFWGLFSLFIAFNGPANPIDDSEIGPGRMALGAFTFALGLLCFMLVPIQLKTI
jgi:membrane-associated protease RseP (regulator of RpoE activity)